MNKEQVLEKVPSGWHHIVDKLFEILGELEYLKIDSVDRPHGLFRINFSESNNHSRQYIADAIQYKIERDCTSICEGCGNHGVRRKIFDPPRVYCTECVVLFYNEYASNNN
jgi:hypothetical protein